MTQFWKSIAAGSGCRKAEDRSSDNHNYNFFNPEGVK